ncbi:MAG: hypothetical protein QOH72_5581 [Solirubrobacteraceae bacterium]|jgi:hypothetical protein|nr:hypothetical protein [Solirubrobacteraceae bacterium]
MPAFRVEVTGMWRDLALLTEESHSQVFLVAAPGPVSAQVAGLQLFGGEAGRRRCLALPAADARVLADAP